MKKMPRVVTFLQLVSMSGSHTTYPNEQEEKAAKRQPTVSTLNNLSILFFINISLSQAKFLLRLNPAIVIFAVSDPT